MSRYLVPEQYERTQFAIALVENNVGPLEQRTGPYMDFSVDILGKPDFHFVEENITDRREIDALFLAQEMARKGFDNFLWISPPGGDYKYPGSRFTWLKVANVTDDKVFFDDNKAICSEIGGEQCLELARKLVKDNGAMWGNPETPEELRSFVIGFKDGKIVDRLEKYLGEMQMVWDKLREGGGGKNLEKMLTVSDWVGTRFGDQLKRIKTEWDSIMVGAMIEKGIRQRFGLSVLAGGVHGMSNEAALGMRASLFNKIYAMLPVQSESLDSRLKRCDRCGNYIMKKRDSCPVCSKH